MEKKGNRYHEVTILFIGRNKRESFLWRLGETETIFPIISMPEDQKWIWRCEIKAWCFLSFQQAFIVHGIVLYNFLYKNIRIFAFTLLLVYIAQYRNKYKEITKESSDSAALATKRSILNKIEKSSHISTRAGRIRCQFFCSLITTYDCMCLLCSM